jgi:hypothetical protein
MTPPYGAQELSQTIGRRAYRKRFGMLRVVQWATGNVGRHTIPLCAAAPGIRTFLELPTIVGSRVLNG